MKEANSWEEFKQIVESSWNAWESMPKIRYKDKNWKYSNTYTDRLAAGRCLQGLAVDSWFGICAPIQRTDPTTGLVINTLWVVYQEFENE